MIIRAEREKVWKRCWGRNVLCSRRFLAFPGMNKALGGLTQRHWSLFPVSACDIIIRKTRASPPLFRKIALADGIPRYSSPNAVHASREARVQLITCENAG